MQLKTYNFSMLGATVIAWASFLLVITNFDPLEANIVVFVFLYFTLFLSTLGTLSLLGFWLHKFFHRKRELSYKTALESFRQAFIFSTVLIVALILQAAKLLNWWNILLLIIFATLLEFIILTFRKGEPK